ncbi:PD-(D/E)XK nuclease family protein [Candidatus Peregrinibacteria bacterium]|jgi:putative RecB family exonuclease|nr:PD-(D/E)XK nuclease family protein [Candidatus Woesearchaeota archaeon]MBT4698158.1 PD-(D/E)XK nuclease family protein [Candidatus Woesearchaeota archaeon]MBT4716361.1 PD-(D/E)XK nuclease family protein [Candidatus Woesearchaeota archaeon]MBT7928454.1 PD-(D/E)XK nuclease family protein [Candidatus Peregrinibacteria bacterium]MBT7930297.1 PD-(D/E)XK nuclease family protein [Candidatus Woesearchaeota archaeon]
MTDRKLSPSSINTYMQCPKKYYYHYIEQLPTKPSIHLLMGSIVHKVLEEFFNRKHNMTGSYRENLKQAITILLENYWDISELKLPEEEQALYRSQATRMVNNFIARFINQIDMLIESKKAVDPNHAFNLIKPKLKEKYYSDDHLNIHGYVDSIEKDFDGNITLIDYKTSQKYKNVLNPDYKRQLAIYALLYQKEEGHLPQLVGIHYLRYGEVFFVEVTPELVTWAEGEVKFVSEKVKTKEIVDYDRKPSKLCRWCDFYDVCWKGEVPPY